VHGKIKFPVISTIGAYDPLTSDHLNLASALVNRCRNGNLSPSVVIITPSPAALLTPDQKMPLHMDLEARIRELQKAGIELVVVASFSREDLELKAYDFLNKLRSVIPLAGIWLGANQSLGTGLLGSNRAVAEYAKEAGMEFKILDLDRTLRQQCLEVQKLLSRGDMGLVKDVTGVYPQVTLRCGKSIEALHWPAGTYESRSLKTPTFIGPIMADKQGWLNGQGLFRGYSGHLEVIKLLSNG
jgi:FAD synthase